MSVEADLFTALRSLVSDRVYPLTFAQPGGALPTWPAIRYTLVVSEPSADVCGDGGDAVADQLVQIDIVAGTYAAVRALRLQVLTAMSTFAPPALWQGDGDTFDVPTKTYRVRMDFTLYPSSTA